MIRGALCRVYNVFKYLLNYFNNSSQTTDDVQMDNKIAAWQIRSYGDISVLQFTREAEMPKISSRNHVLIKVHASSVNPIDVVMLEGYGRKIMNLLRSNKTEFPITFGRDFSGVVVNKGAGVGDKFSVGQSVWGVVMPYFQGSQAEYVVIDKKFVSDCPSNVTYIEAASILYAGLTAYSGIVFNGGMATSAMKGKRVIVLGAAGGVGSFAVQILKAGGATVLCTCSPDAIPLVTSLGVDIAIDRNSVDFEKQLIDNGPYDMILDCAGQGPSYASKYKWNYKKFVTFTAPLLKNFDEGGLIGGLFRNIWALTSNAVTAIREGRSTHWAHVKPTTEGIEHLKKLVEQNQLKTAIERVFPFDKTPDAFQAMMNGHVRGKIVIDVIGDTATQTNQ